MTKAGVLALLLSSLGVSLLTAAEKQQQPEYRFTEIPVPGPSFAYGINDHGLVTGSYSDPTTGDALSFVFEHGKVTTGIAAPGATDTFLGPANNRDVESGNSGDPSNQRPVLYNIRHGIFAPLPEIPGRPLNFANGINDAGHVVGVAYASGDAFNGGTGIGQNWFWDGEDYSFFTVPGANGGASVGGINNRDQISGYYFADLVSPPHGFVMDGTSVTTLDVPGVTYTIAAGINNQGVVTGNYLIAPHGHHGFVWFQGKFVTVDDNLADSAGTEWIGINDHGDVAGLYFDTSAQHLPHAVIGVRVDGNAFWDDAE